MNINVRTETLTVITVDKEDIYIIEGNPYSKNAKGHFTPVRKLPDALELIMQSLSGQDSNKKATAKKPAARKPVVKKSKPAAPKTESKTELKPAAPQPPVDLSGF